MTEMPSRLVIALFWLLHWLPLPLLARCGEALGMLLYALAARRRHIVMVNLRLCFAELDESARRRLARRHFRALGRSLLERGLLWWASRERLLRLIKVDNETILTDLRKAGRPIILLAPHFVGLDAGGLGIVMRCDVVSVYAQQKNRIIDRQLYLGRRRFGDQMLLSRSDGIRATVKAMKSGRPFYYLPDMDFRSRDAIFVPFFGVATSTITSLPRLARLAGAVVVPCATRMLPGGQGYVVELGAPWSDYPSDDVAADARRMNEWIESVVRTMPEQYYWVHRRFKTRPAGERKPY